MNRRVRLWVSASFYYSGLVGIARKWAQRYGPRLTVVYYHQSSKVDLRSHWLYLRRHYRIVPLEAALEELRAPSQQRASEQDRRPLMAVTFDDGYLDNYEKAFPLARELQIPITIFLISGYIEKGNALWWATRLLRVAPAGNVTFEGQPYDLRDLDERQALAEAIDARYSQCTSSRAREQFLTSLYKTLSMPSSFALKEQPAPLVSWKQVSEMEESGWVTYGAHTVHHPNLGELTDPAVARYEVEESRLDLQQRLGHEVRTFAYPFGGTGEYGPGAARQAGFDWALTTQSGENVSQTDPHLLFRRNMDGPKHWLVVAAETAGIWSFFSRMGKSGRALVREPIGQLSGEARVGG